MKTPCRKLPVSEPASTGFAKRLLVDILSFPELGHSTMYDIDAKRLRASERPVFLSVLALKNMRN